MVKTNSFIFSFFSRRFTRILICGTFLAFSAMAQKQAAPPPAVFMGSEGKLEYTPDSLGNRVPDFSYSGYMAAEQPIPDVPIRVVVPLKEGDATLRIQTALDYVASLPANQDGIRGAVLLQKGIYNIAGSLKMNASGVVLRGSGMSADGTVLLGSGKGRETLINIVGKNDRTLESAVKITDSYVPVNSKRMQVTASHSFRPGDKVVVHRPSTQEWIDVLGTEEFGGGLGYIGWKPGDRDIYWDRTVEAVEDRYIILDAPITTALDEKFGGGTVAAYQWPGRIFQVGVENLMCRSAYDVNNPKDEAHRWMAISMENVSDAWVRQVVFEHFAGSAVAVLETAKRITVEDCKSLAPVSEIGGHRRYTFFTLGQQTLFQRIYAENGYHDFAVGYCAPGPNAFVQCESRLPYSFSGTIDSWASGVLFDVVNIDGQALSLKNRGLEAQGAGWTGANSVIWQCSAARIDCYKPPTANNWAFGVWAQFAGDGYWHEVNSHIQPHSLYYAQLADRLGKDVSDRAQLLLIETSATSSPTIEQAATITALSTEPAPQLADWIDRAAQREPIPIDPSGVSAIDKIDFEQPAKKATAVKKAGEMHLENGWLVYGNSVLTGKQQTVRWWRGTLQPTDLEKAQPHITRFVPGRRGSGLIDSLGSVTEWMAAHNTVAIDHNYGLWYDRRRDDHERVRRMDGEVWAPFYELPYARSGQGIAWDGLSKYDLTKFNRWYWDRLRQFADLADQKGLVLLHQNYFQHNILEAGAHWADSPWRPANNINDTGFPEPPPYAGDKRIFLAEQFYDVTHPVRRELHQHYIRKCLENFEEHNSVIQSISAEYTGPLDFVQFWIDTILAWEKETGKTANIALSTTKDVQDAILADPVRAKVVDVIDIRYWHYREGGSLYAPKGGQNLAPRQHARLVKPGKKSFEQTYRAVREYRQKYPEKAVIYSTGGHDVQLGWASFMAGGSLASIPAMADKDFLTEAVGMQPINLAGNPAGQWALGNTKGGYIIYNDSDNPVSLDLKNAAGKFLIRWIDPEDGSLIKEASVKGKSSTEIKNSGSGPVVLWVTRK